MLLQDNVHVYNSTRCHHFFLYDRKKQKVEDNQVQLLAQVLTEVPYVGSKLDCLSLVALQATSTELRASLRAPGIWQEYLRGQGQQLQAPPLVVTYPPTPPPAPLRPSQSFAQQCTVWYTLLHPSFAHHTYCFQAFRRHTYPAWFRALEQYAPGIYEQWHKQQQKQLDWQQHRRQCLLLTVQEILRIVMVGCVFAVYACALMKLGNWVEANMKQTPTTAKLWNDEFRYVQRRIRINLGYIACYIGLWHYGVRHEEFKHLWTMWGQRKAM